jgi:Flp pilus assembly protein TadD
MIKVRLFRCLLSCLLLTTGLLLAGCAAPSAKTKPSGEKYSAEVAGLLTGKAVLGHEVSPQELPNLDIFHITPEMEAFAKNAIRHSESYYDRVKRLHVALLSSEDGGRSIAYNAYVTEVPSVTFAQRRANCLSFTLLYVAMARAVGINAQVNEVQIPPTWDLRNKKEMVYLRHVNVKVPISRENPNILNNDDVIIDLEMDRFRSNYRQYSISDDLAAAQFYSNRAMEYLENNNYVDTFLSLRKSISLNDKQSYVWGNLGVLYSRMNLWREAEFSYLHGLEVDPEDLTLMNNLSYLYRQTGNKDLADKYSRLAQKYRESNPFFQYSLALSAFNQGEYTAALELITKAIKREETDIRFYELAANIYGKLGRTKSQSDMLKKVKKLKPLEAYSG